MAMDTAGATSLIQAALVANMAAPDTATAQANLAAAHVAAITLMLSTATIAVSAGLSGATGPVTGTIAAGSIT